MSVESPPVAHHQLIIDAGQRIADGHSKRVMLFMPPGSAKSFYGNVLASAWWLGRNPGKKLITASYTQEVADKWGRRVRGIIRSDEHQSVFRDPISGESSAAGRWATESDAEYYAVGVGGSVTSFRADFGIIDDPVKGREEADSETIRRKTVDWYQSDFWTRLKPGAAVMLIMTRWHEADLAGWLLEEATRGGEQWEVVSLPMIAEANDPLGRMPGEQLWPEWFTPDMVEIARRNARNWSALYQQRPAPEEGSYFKRDWLRYYEAPPPGLTIYGASDYAVTAGGGDYTVHGIAGVDHAENLYVLDWWRDQTDSLVWIDQLLDMMRRWKPRQWAEESGQIIKSLGPLINKRIEEQRLYETWRRQYTSAADKPTRAQAIRGRMAQGKVYLPRNAPWLAEFERELLTFPAGKHDDQVDVMSLFGRILAEMEPGTLPKPPVNTDIVPPAPSAGQALKEHLHRARQARDQ